MKKTLFLMAAAAMLFGACCDKQEPTSQANPTDVVMQNILNRKSVRSYDGKAIPDSVMENLLRAAMAAPSGMNWQPWSFVVLTDKSQYETIFAGNGNMEKFKNSGAVVVLCADTIHDGQPNPMWRDDMGAVTENLLLAVEAYGLGACWTACYPFPDKVDQVKKSLGLPASVVPYAVVPIGYHDGTAQPKDKWDSTRIHRDRW